MCGQYGSPAASLILLSTNFGVHWLRTATGDVDVDGLHWLIWGQKTSSECIRVGLSSSFAVGNLYYRNKIIGPRVPTHDHDLVFVFIKLRVAVAIFH